MLGSASAATSGTPAHGAYAGHTVLVGGPGEEVAEPPARRLEERARVAVGEAPGRLGAPGAGLVAGVAGWCPRRRARAGRRPPGRPLSSGCNWDRLPPRAVMRAHGSPAAPTSPVAATTVTWWAASSSNGGVQLVDLRTGDAVLPADLAGGAERNNAARPRRPSARRRRRRRRRCPRCPGRSL